MMGLLLNIHMVIFDEYPLSPHRFRDYLANFKVGHQLLDLRFSSALDHSVDQACMKVGAQ